MKLVSDILLAVILFVELLARFLLDIYSLVHLFAENNYDIVLFLAIRIYKWRNFKGVKTVWKFCHGKAFSVE